VAQYPVILKNEGEADTVGKMFFLVTGSPRHPRWGAGVFSMLKLPGRFEEAKIGENVFDLNMLEQESPTRSHYLGSWCINDEDLPVFISFIPWFLCSEEILLDQLLSDMERISWINSVEYY
jgi:hypothetical protein